MNILTNNNYVSTKIISKKRIAALTFTGYNVIIDKDLLIPLEGKYGNVEKNAFSQLRKLTISAHFLLPSGLA